MNPPKVTDEDYINFIIATPRDVTATEAERVQPDSRTLSPTMLSHVCLPDSNPMRKRCVRKRERKSICKAVFWFSMIRRLRKIGYSEFNALVYRHWSGKQREVVNGINLITLLWTDGTRCVPVDYRLFDKARNTKTKNDHFAEMLQNALERGFNPALICFDSWYGSIDNLKLVRARLAFFDPPEIQPTDQNERRQTASGLRVRLVRQCRHALLT